MATLLLNRKCTLVDAASPTAAVVCEPREGVSQGWLARIAADPANPFGLWRRDFLAGVASRLDGRAVLVYAHLAPGVYEAHSVLRSRQPQAVCLAVAAGGAVEVLGGRGDEDVVIAHLNGMTVDELHDARAAAVGAGEPALEGSFRQVGWGRTIRNAFVDAALDAGDDELAVGLWDVRQASFFIAHRHHTLDELRERLGLPDRRGAGLRPAHPRGE